MPACLFSSNFSSCLSHSLIPYTPHYFSRHQFLSASELNALPSNICWCTAGAKTKLWLLPLQVSFVLVAQHILCVCGFGRHKYYSAGKWLSMVCVCVSFYSYRRTSVFNFYIRHFVRFCSMWHRNDRYVNVFHGNNSDIEMVYREQMSDGNMLR